MQLCDVTLDSPEENLALDEALLDECEDTGVDEVLRFWEPRQHFVVMGYGNRVSLEVNLDYCRGNSIPVLRRPTGGGTVLQGPGCLNYALVLRICERSTQSISETNDFVMQKQATALSEALNAQVTRQGQTDLALGGRKFCGNAQRRRRNYLIFHGCFLLGLDFDLVERVLPMPSKQPDYRANRSHKEFLRNLPVSAEVVKNTVAKAWVADQVLMAIPTARLVQLARDKYGQDSWNLRF